MTVEGTLAKEQETQEEDGARDATMTPLRVGASANFAENLGTCQLSAGKTL